MKRSNEALLIIDYTNDFVATNGALTTGAVGQAIESEIIKLANQELREGGMVILPTDVHEEGDPYHPETKLFPPHNLRGTWGRDFYGQLQDWYDLNKTEEKVEILDKTRYSSFTGTDLDLQLRARKIDTVRLVGVCTDICVLHTAVDAYNLGYKIIVNEKGVATFTEHGQEWALEHFKGSLGAKVE
jgi:nicotinamidase-related amidase